MNRFSFIIFALLLSCSYVKSPVPPTPVTVLPFAFNKEVLSETGITSRLQVHALYSQTGHSMIWMDTLKTKPAGDSLINFILHSDHIGLMPSDYHDEEIFRLKGSSLTHEDAAKLDVLLTDAFFTMFEHLRGGRVDLKKNIRRPLDSLLNKPIVDQLQSAVSDNRVVNILRDCEPKDQDYSLLKKELSALIKFSGTDSISIRKQNSLIATLERRRIGGTLPSRFLRVNIPGFDLKIVEDDSAVFQSKVIIGTPETPTPNIRSVIRSFIIYPYWHVPKSILDEILPNIQADTNYVVKHNYDVIDKNGKKVKRSNIDWKKYDAETFPYTLRQREGAENTMGVIKFVFPNNYGVYLHDTNARGLFSKKDRALSHGCIRVQKAVALAHYLAKDDDTFVGPEDLDQYLVVQHKMEVQVVKPLPVYLDYFTADVKENKVVFFNDLYGWDAALMEALQSKPL